MMISHNILNLTETCTGCFACANICPKDAISLPAGFEGFYYPQIDLTRCIDCGLCEKICPQINPQDTKTMCKAYYGWSNDNFIRKQSSSGGIFYHLATSVLNENGIVYGASFNYNGLVRLECHSTQEVSLNELMKSKYVQSYIGYAFREIRENLNKGTKVLFCGTPCQAAGLKSFLRKDYDNLILVDFVCHGVPSMDLLQKHLAYLGIKNVVEIDFRPKNSGWVDDFEIKFLKKSAKPTSTRLHRIPWALDEYFYSFQNYKSTRRSCRNCSYCNGQRASDITIADFWGIKKYKPELWDKRGQSLILCNNTKGIEIVHQLRGLFLEELPIENATYVYERIRSDASSPYQDTARDKFLSDVYAIGYKKALIANGLMTPKSTLFKLKIKTLLNKLINMKKII